jgi:hypothetical protein
MFQEADFQGLIAVNRNGEANDAALLSVDVMAAVNSKQAPSVTF